MKLTTSMACAVFVAAPFATLASMDVIQDYKIDAAFAGLDNIRNAVAEFVKRQHHLPTEAEGLNALAVGGDRVLDRVPADPWRHPFVYRMTSQGPGFVVYSSGRDGIDEQGAGDDVTTRDKSYRCLDYYGDCPLTPRWWRFWTPIAAFFASFALLGARLGRWLSPRLKRA